MPFTSRTRSDAGARGGGVVRVIVQADDLGASLRANRETFAMMAAGKVTSATLMAGGPALEDALARLPEFPHVSFGAHLSLTEHGPLTRDRRLDFLCGANGRFAGRRAALRDYRLLWRRDVQEAVFTELAAQVELLLERGVRISHFDSHHHVHTIGAMLPIIKRLQRAFGIRRLRIRMNLFDGAFHPHEGPVQYAKTVAVNRALRHVFSSATPDAFTALRAFVHPAAHACVRPGQVVEVMVHPGHPLCEEETALLGSDWARKLPFAVRLVSYDDLPIPRREWWRQAGCHRVQPGRQG